MTKNVKGAYEKHAGKRIDVGVERLGDVEADRLKGKDEISGNGYH